MKDDGEWGDEGRFFRESPSCVVKRLHLVSYCWPHAPLKRDATSQAVARRHLLRLHLATPAMATSERPIPSTPQSKMDGGSGDRMVVYDLQPFSFENIDEAIHAHDSAADRF